jgi:hypothetical protein
MSLRLRIGRLEERAVAEALSPRVGQPAEALLADDGADHSTQDRDRLREATPRA